MSIDSCFPDAFRTFRSIFCLADALGFTLVSTTFNVFLVSLLIPTNVKTLCRAESSLFLRLNSYSFRSAVIFTLGSRSELGMIKFSPCLKFFFMITPLLCIATSEFLLALIICNVEPNANDIKAIVVTTIFFIFFPFFY